ncbi:Tn3 family transposase [Nonomuraea sp. B1E8]
MVKHATALRLRTAESHQMLRRFTRGGPKHPTYQAIEELAALSERSTSAITSRMRSSRGRSARG